MWLQVEFRNSSRKITRNAKTVTYETESISFLVPKTRSRVPQEIKKLQISKFFFKESIRKWKPNRPVGFIKLTVNILVLYNFYVIFSRILWNLKEKSQTVYLNCFLGKDTSISLIVTFSLELPVIFQLNQ